MSSLRVKLPACIHPPLDINTLERIEGDISNSISHLRRSNAELQAALDEGDDPDFKAALVSGCSAIQWSAAELSLLLAGREHGDHFKA